MSRKLKMLEILKSPGWEKVFAFASNPAPTADHDNIFIKPFTREDVSKILSLRAGQMYKSGWACLCRLNDRRYAMVYATPNIGDPTWEEKGSGWAHTSFLLRDMIRFYMGSDSRTRLAKDIREFVHRDDAEDKEKEVIAELVLEETI